MFYSLFYRYNAFSIRKLRGRYPIRAHLERVFPKAQDTLLLLDPLI